MQPAVAAQEKVQEAGGRRSGRLQRFPPGLLHHVFRDSLLQRQAAKGFRRVVPIQGTGQGRVEGRGALSPAVAQRGRRFPFSLYHVLSGGVVVGPFKPFAENLGGEAGDGGEVFPAAPQGRAGGDAAQPSRLAPHNPVFQPAEEHRDLYPLGAAVNVGLVQDEEAPVPAGLPVKEDAVLRPEEEVFQHGVVGQQDVGRPGLHLTAAEEFVGDARLAGELFLEAGFGPPVLFLRLAGIAAEGDGGEVPQDPT